jgi:pilus assembly protein CpaB
MKSKTMILLLVAVVCGLGAAFMTSRLLADRNERVAILVAKQKFSPWTVIRNPEEQFELEERLRNEVPKNAVLKFEAVKDHLLIKGLDKGDPVVAENLLSKEKGGMEVMLPQGKRAVAVRTTAEKVAGGFVLPGSHVDVIHTLRRGDQQSESRVVLQNILVRAVDQQAMKPEDRPGLVPATVTLEVTPQQALVLARVADVGSVTLALRPTGDDLVQRFDSPAPPKPVEVKPPPVVKAAPPPPKKAEPPVDRKTLVIQNGSQWIRATYITRNGQMTTSIETNHADYVPPPPAVTPAPAPNQEPPPPPPPPRRVAAGPGGFGK